MRCDFSRKSHYPPVVSPDIAYQQINGCKQGRRPRGCGGGTFAVHQ